MTFWLKPKTGTVTGRVFLDANGDNTENNGSGGFDAGLTGVTVQLLNEWGHVVATTTTDAHGNYSFTANEGDYRIKVLPPAGFEFIKSDVGASGEDSDVGANGVSVHEFEIDRGETLKNIDAGLRQTFRLDAVNDAITVAESEDSGDSDGHLLANDIAVGGAVATVTAVNGAAGGVGQFVDLAGGGRVKIDANGKIDFDADGDFEDLDAGETRDVTVTYTISTTKAVSGGKNLLVNGNFEDHGHLRRDGGLFASWDVFDSISGWKTPVGKLELQSGTHSGGPKNSSSNTYLELDSDDATDTNATVVQDVHITSAGLYTFSFEYSPRGAGANTAATSTAIILVNGVAIDTITSSTVGFKHFSYTIQLGAGVNTIGFQGGGLDDTVGALIDNVSLVQTAEVISDTATVTITVTGETDNVAPTIDTGNLSAAENETAIATLAATDADGDAVTWSISGADAGFFNIDPATGALSWKVAPDFETPLSVVNGDNIYDVTITANDGNGGVTSKDIFVTVTNVNEAPVVTSGAAFAVDENGLGVGTVTAVDPDGDAVTFSLSGDDAALFAIDPATGAISFIAAPDFEAPADLDGNNVYDVVVTVSDGTLSSDQAVAITVGDVAENGAPAFVSAPVFALDENGTTVGTVSAVDPDADPITYSLSGDDAGLFTIDSVTGEISFIAAPDFEAPLDANGDNTYDVVVTASDGTLSTDQTVAITVAGVNEAPAVTSAATFALDENTTSVGTATAVDPDGDAVSFSLSGDDAGLFTIDSVTGEISFIAAPDFEAPLDANGDNTYDVVVTASDGTLSTDQTVAITVAGVNEGPAITSAATVTIDENGTAAQVVTAADPDGDALTFSLIGGDDAALFEIDPVTGALVFLAAPDFEAPTDANGDNVYVVEVAVSDAGGLTDTQTVTVSVAGIAETGALDDAFNATDGAVLNVGAGAGLLANDEVAAGGTLTVVSAGGAAAGTPVAGSNGGTFIIGADGSISFDPGSDFVFLGATESADTSIDYTIDDGLGTTSTGTATVTVQGVNSTPFLLDSAFDNENNPFFPGVSVIPGDIGIESGSGGPGDTVTDLLFFRDPDVSDTFTFTLSGLDAASFETSFVAADDFATYEVLPGFGLDDFGVVVPNGATGLVELRPSVFLDNTSLSADGDATFNITLTINDGNGGVAVTDYEIVIT